MRRQITEYIRKCLECQRYKATNRKPQGLIQTPVMQQRFEVLAIDLFGPLPPTTDAHQWIFIIEDVSTRWVELTALKEATATACATYLLEEIFLRYGLPRRIISDNGVQFVSAVMQCLFHLLNIHQSLTLAYHPEANPVERKNRDLKAELAILVQQDHTQWYDKLPVIRFAMNTATCSSTRLTPAYLMFGRELRTLDDVGNDFKPVITKNNFISEIQPKLLKLRETFLLAKETHANEQQRQKKYKDNKRDDHPYYKVGDLVWINTHVLSNAANKVTSKFMPKRDGPYTITKQISATSYQIAHKDDLDTVLGTYHASAITPFIGHEEEVPQPVKKLRKRGRPKKQSTNQTSCRRIDPIATPEGETVTQPTIEPRSSPQRLSTRHKVHHNR